MGTNKKEAGDVYARVPAWAARLVIDTGQVVAAVAREIRVSEQLLGRWVHTERDRVGGGAGAPG